MESKNLSLLFGDDKKLSIRDPQGANFFKAPYTESDILELQNIFLSEGFHQIKTTDLGEGRALIKLFLDSLHCYRNPGCFTKEAGAQKAIDIAQELHSTNIELFFDENPYIDFMWIEMPLENEPGEPHAHFMRNCESLQLEKKMPILILHRNE